MTFKRNQVEGALYAVLSGPPWRARERLGREIPQPFRTRIQRLLEIDRNWGHENQHRLHEFGMAFYDELPSGSGQDSRFSAFRVFNLAVGLELLRFGCKQREVVEKMALLQDDLQQAFDQATETLATRGREKGTDSTKIQLPKATSGSRSGQKPPDPSIFLVVSQVEASDRLAARSAGAIKAGEVLFDHEICAGWEDLTSFLKEKISSEANGVFLLELSQIAARLVELLEMQPVRSRGRS